MSTGLVGSDSSLPLIIKAMGGSPIKVASMFPDNKALTSSISETDEEHNAFVDDNHQWADTQSDVEKTMHQTDQSNGQQMSQGSSMMGGGQQQPLQGLGSGSAPAGGQGSGGGGQGFGSQQGAGQAGGDGSGGGGSSHHHDGNSDGKHGGFSEEELKKIKDEGIPDSEKDKHDHHHDSKHDGGSGGDTKTETTKVETAHTLTDDMSASSVATDEAWSDNGQGNSVSGSKLSQFSKS